ncbi:hypothetical protein A8C75_01255 [Marinobacterium aestuarii]|uniref:Glycosyltransferase subfamily 4-like N-terminal domain-containing protein n=1 Tax=Marinobacterium aestuarii TaxID=1821621 RepID=A0A1A9EUH5_9GAMM|nr:hypothetical protein [Marinobacterium aestuarii]ANG61219.1 hypothetical protein A8C75_01255 [Marinobacterium aestuarii]
MNRLGHYFNLKYCRHADYWVGISKGICKHLIDGAIPVDRVVHIPNFAEGTPVEPLTRDSFEAPPDRPLILAAGRLYVNKALDVLLHSLVGLPDVILWLARGLKRPVSRCCEANWGWTNTCTLWAGGMTSLRGCVPQTC